MHKWLLLLVADDRKRKHYSFSTWINHFSVNLHLEKANVCLCAFCLFIECNVLYITTVTTIYCCHDLSPPNTAKALYILRINNAQRKNQASNERCSLEIFFQPAYHCGLINVNAYVHRIQMVTANFEMGKKQKKKVNHRFIWFYQSVLIAIGFIAWKGDCCV